MVSTIKASAGAPAVVEAVTLYRSPEDVLEAGWTVSGDCEAVDVAWGFSPYARDHEQAQRFPVGEGRASRNGEGTARLYVSVAPAGTDRHVVGAERLIRFAGARNFRDIGGYAAADGRRVLWGQVFRADALQLTASDLEIFEQLGIRTVWDLRSADERASVPDQLPPSVANVFEVSLVAERDLSGLGTVDDGEKFLARVYEKMMRNAAREIGQIIGGLAGAAGLPGVFHCTAGKDRTGIIGALLLSALGVSRSAILDDYELTSQVSVSDQVRAIIERSKGKYAIRPEALAGMLGTPRWVMEKTLERLDLEFGGVEQYLVNCAGVEPHLINALRHRLLA